MILWAATAHAWDVNSVDWVYQEARIEEGFSLHADSFAEVADADAIEALFLASLDTWNIESEADLYVTYGGRTAETDQGGGDDHVNTSVYGSVNFAAGLAVATIGFSGARLNDCDIAFHRRNLYGAIAWHVGPDAAPSGSYDLANTMVHEIGHCLGMNHSERASAIMYGFNVDGTGEESRHLSDDDRAGIQFLYGRVAPELVADGATLTGEPTHGAPVEAIVTIRNIGDGSAFYVEADGVQLGHLGAPTPVGARVGPETVELALTATVDCASDAVDLAVVAVDARERSTPLAWTVPIDCEVPADPPAPGEEPEPTEADPGAEVAAGGCGCGGGAAPPEGALAALLLLLRRGGARSRRA